MKDEYVKVCPYCGGTEMIETTNMAKASNSISPVGNFFKAAPLFRTVCMNCGSVVRTYVKEPQKLR